MIPYDSVVITLILFADALATWFNWRALSQKQRAKIIRSVKELCERCVRIATLRGGMTSRSTMRTEELDALLRRAKRAPVERYY